MTSCQGSEFHRETHRYGQKNILQEISVYYPRSGPQPDPSSSVWIIYIHGGAWRDPAITSISFEPTLDALASDCDSQTLQRVAAFASIDYRLSANPNFPQDPTSTEPTDLRCAIHPDHLNDVRNAIAYLQNKFEFRERYILVGHSCGATLAFQTVMGSVLNAESKRSEATELNIELPIAIVGVAGIYDLRLLRDTFKDIVIYQEFIKAAFGSDEKLWDGVSPARVEGQTSIENWWANGRLAVLAHSEADELVDVGQLRTMAKVIGKWRAAGTRGLPRNLLLLDDLKHSHDEIWSKGDELAQVIAKTVFELQRLEKS
ncbi:esterase/lipase domain containing protein [Histoplasma ohiense]|nr:esterase/lipase domain containing protein [Histoplasma ohiense (nom. inval.)]